MNKKRIVIVISIILLVILVGCFCYYLRYKNNNSSNDIGNNNLKEDNIISNEDKENIEDADIEDEVIDKDDDNKINVVNYYEDIYSEVSSGKWEDVKVKAKEGFISIVDFIFYDKEINGYTFDELSMAGKARIIKTALLLDSKIEEYIPNYKEEISSTSGKIYNNVKEKLVTLYLDISSDICNNYSEECDNVKEDFAIIKSKCKIGWEFIKGLFNDGKDKLKEWYEIFSGK